MILDFLAKEIISSACWISSSHKNATPSIPVMTGITKPSSFLLPSALSGEAVSQSVSSSPASASGDHFAFAVLLHFVAPRETKIDRKAMITSEGSMI